MATTQTQGAARKQEDLITLKPGPATAAVGGTCHSQFAKDLGPDVFPS